MKIDVCHHLNRIDEEVEQAKLAKKPSVSIIFDNMESLEHLDEVLRILKARGFEVSSRALKPDPIPDPSKSLMNYPRGEITITGLEEPEEDDEDET